MGAAARAAAIAPTANVLAGAAAPLLVVEAPSPWAVGEADPVMTWPDPGAVAVTTMEFAMLFALA
jgi:hypothetical protein